MTKNSIPNLALCTEAYELIKPEALEDAYDFYLEYAKIEKLKVMIYKQNHLKERLKSPGFSHMRTLKALNGTKQPSNQYESIVYECRK